jgi:tRNA pseudouridine38-40 synthase
MVRRMVGVLVEVGRGGLDAEAVTDLLQGPSPLPARLTAPASGLFLEQVRYAGEARPATVAPATPLRAIAADARPRQK